MPLTVEPLYSLHRPLVRAASNKVAALLAQALSEKKSLKSAAAVAPPVTVPPPAAQASGAPASDDVDDEAVSDVEGEALLRNPSAVGDSAVNYGVSDDEDFDASTRSQIKGAGAPAAKTKGTSRKRAKFEPREKRGGRW